MFKAHRFMYHSTLGSRVIKKKKTEGREGFGAAPVARGLLLSFFQA